jgi:DNA-binding IclR family transcriptional regulator
MTRSRRGIQSIEVGGTLLQALVDAIGHTVALAVLGTHGPTIVYIHESLGFSGSEPEIA